MNPMMEISEFDSDSSRPMVLCLVPSEGGHIRFAVPAVYMELVRAFDGTRSVDEAIDIFLRQEPDARPRDWLRRLVIESLLPKGILVRPDQDPSRAAISSQPRQAFLYIKLPLMKPGMVDPVAKRLGFLFRRGIMLLGLLVFVAVHVYVYGMLLRTNAFDFSQLDTQGILILLLLSTAGAIVHEFGHASAAAYFGCRKITIGWGLYLIYSVLWTDVSDAWKLPRQQRAIVDIGGVYLQSFFLVLVLALYLLTGNSIFLFAFVLNDFAIAMTTFNPFIRMDGYWLMSDLFGIVNLRRQQMIWGQDILARIFGGHQTGLSRLSRRAKWALTAYTVLGTLYLAYLVKVVFKLVVLNVAESYPAMLHDLWQQASDGMPVLAFLRALLEIGWRTMLIFGAAMVVFRATKASLGLAAKLCGARSHARLPPGA
ncbi:hypothetical protein B1806_14555 [Metallibacterium scheffleri]|uniref:Peptidase M50 domain-containing protein n=2 Tax=Metallibacterium scheffleri TaxID=993689 RepID=A0A4S3KII2_9GAMM|nr:hypothetical protein B1806_14555 [Metallibacterium scheffleri]